jgi:hypothetical protein
MRRLGRVEPNDDENDVAPNDLDRGESPVVPDVGIGMPLVEASPGLSAFRRSSSCSFSSRSRSLRGAWNDFITTLLGNGGLDGLDGRDSSHDVYAPNRAEKVSVSKHGENGQRCSPGP